MGRRTWLTVFQCFDTLVIGAIKNLRQFVSAQARQAWQNASSTLSLEGEKQSWRWLFWFFFPQTIASSGQRSMTVRWQSDKSLFPHQEALASSHRRMKTATIKQANQLIKIIVGLLACRVLKICKLQSFLRITCRSNYLLLLPAVGGWTDAVANLQPHVKGRRHPYGVCSDGGSLCLWRCTSCSSRWHTGAAGERGTSAWCLHAAWGWFKPHCDQFGGILTLVWPSVPEALWSTGTGQLWWGMRGGWGLVRGNHVNLSSGWFVASSTNHLGKQGQPTSTARL